MKKKYVLALIFGLLVLSGCMNTGNRQSGGHFALAPVPKNLPAYSKNWQMELITSTKNKFHNPESLSYNFLTDPTPCSIVLNKKANGKNGIFMGDFYCGQVGITGKKASGSMSDERLYIYLIGEDHQYYMMDYNEIMYLFIFNPPIQAWQ